MSTVSGYTTTRNCIEQRYPFVESISSMLNFCNEVVVVDGGSTDGTWEKLREMSTIQSDGRLIVKQFKRNWENPKHAVYDGQQKAIARALCKSEWLWQQDSDEIVHEDDYNKIKPVIAQIEEAHQNEIHIVALPVIEYWGGLRGKVRIDVNPWKCRLSRNLPIITHGIPGNQRKFDSSGDVYSAGSDGCCYIHSKNFQDYPYAQFFNDDYLKLKQAAMTSPAALNEYEKLLNSIVDQLPGVHHYSWFNLERKINTYKNYWSKHWSSLFNVTIEDLPEHNKFFNKKWSDVTDEDIKLLANRLEKEMGGWVFHRRIDFSKPTPWIYVDRDHPKIMAKWISENSGR